MDIEKLIKMANQIGDFYEAYPDKDEAAKEIGGHLNRFWNSSMRKGIVGHVESKQGVGLHPCVVDAVRKHVHQN
jgi:formate dehydrogenase subunit delta